MPDSRPALRPVMRAPLRHAALALLAGGLACSLPSQDVPDGFRLDAFVTRYCVECHGADDPEAGLDLAAELRANPTDEFTLLEIRDVLDSVEMPPAKAEQPSPAERRAALAVIAADLRARTASGPVDPGRVTVRRLSRAEYANTVRDVLGVDVDVAAFPADDLGYGFDNIGDALSVSALHLDVYARTAEWIAARAFPDPDPDEPVRRRHEAEAMAGSDSVRPAGDVAALTSNGSVRAGVDLPRAGSYRVHVTAFGRQAGDEPARMTVRAGRESRTFDVPATRDAPGTYAFEFTADEPHVVVQASFDNDYYRPDAKDPDDRDRNLYIDWIEVEGPLERRTATAAEERFLAADPGRGTTTTRARRVLTPLLRLAWRRDVDRGDVAPFARLVDDVVDDGSTFAEGLRWAVQAILLTPHFLFRIEDGGLGTDGEIDDLDGFERATRLAYFLWSSAPDEALLDAAADGELDDVDGLLAAARRMLADERAAALASNFAAQWLELRRLDEMEPDASLGASWSPELARAMRRETELLFLDVLRRDLPVRRLLDADYTFVDPRLARHYGWEPPPTDAPDAGGATRVSIPDPRRRGILAHASILTVTSNPTRTSPVKRGKWILENVLDDPPPPPPPGNDAFAGGEESVRTAADLRAQLAAHRADARCAVCHDRMDALGLAMENFDAVGRWRERDGGSPIDASGVLPDGTVLDGPVDLKDTLASAPQFVRALAKRLFVYAVGRGAAPRDVLAIEAMLEELPAEPTLTALVEAVVRLDAFHRRRIVPKR